MNKELTAIQILIGELDVCISNLGKKTDLATRMQKGRLVDAKTIAKRLLQKEQEQIEKAFTYGRFFHDENKKQSAKEYYKSKYGGEDVD